MPQTTHSITAVSGSNHAPAVAVKSFGPLPVLIHVNQSTARPYMCSSPATRPIMPNSSVSDMTAEMPTAIQIGQCDFSFRCCHPRNPLIAAAMSGRRGIR
jgi:hypothetical protein